MLCIDTSMSEEQLKDVLEFSQKLVTQFMASLLQLGVAEELATFMEYRDLLNELCSSEITQGFIGETVLPHVITVGIGHDCTHAKLVAYRLGGEAVQVNLWTNLLGAISQELESRNRPVFDEILRAISTTTLPCVIRSRPRKKVFHNYRKVDKSTLYVRTNLGANAFLKEIASLLQMWDERNPTNPILPIIRIDIVPSNKDKAETEETEGTEEIEETEGVEEIEETEEVEETEVVETEVVETEVVETVEVVVEPEIEYPVTGVEDPRGAEEHRTHESLRKATSVPLKQTSEQFKRFYLPTEAPPRNKPQGFVLGVREHSVSRWVDMLPELWKALTQHRPNDFTLKVYDAHKKHGKYSPFYPHIITAEHWESTSSNNSYTKDRSTGLYCLTKNGAGNTFKAFNAIQKALNLADDHIKIEVKP